MARNFISSQRIKVIGYRRLRQLVKPKQVAAALEGRAKRKWPVS
jgi:hypothetical protein